MDHDEGGTDRDEKGSADGELGGTRSDATSSAVRLGRDNCAGHRTGSRAGPRSLLNNGVVGCGWRENAAMAVER